MCISFNDALCLDFPIRACWEKNILKYTKRLFPCVPVADILAVEKK